MSKKVLSLLFISILALVMITGIATASETSDVTITLEGDSTIYPGTFINGNTLIPLMSLVQSMDLKITWYPGVKEVTLTSGDIIITYLLDSTTITINGDDITSPTAPQLIDNQEYLPLRIIAENFGYTVSWDNATSSVTLSK